MKVLEQAFKTRSESPATNLEGSKFSETHIRTATYTSMMVEVQEIGNPLVLDE